jgi:hypothetical protein
MKVRIAFAMLAALMLSACQTHTGRIPVGESGIYTPQAPFENIKQSFYVRERERPLLGTIDDASTSIALFLIDVTHASSEQLVSTIHRVLPEARDRLRLPPAAAFDPTLRYVGMRLYCWQSKETDRLEFLIEWADMSNARYTDSYVFVRRGSAWYFDRHGSTPPWHWTQTERYFQRSCPSASP